jgi:hypothetical protein
MWAETYFPLKPAQSAPPFFSPMRGLAVARPGRRGLPPMAGPDSRSQPDPAS